MLSNGRAVPPLFALPVLAAGAVLSRQDGWVCALVAIVALGVPHGALDLEIGRNLLRDRIGKWWFPAFAVPYLVLVGTVLLAWRWAPEAALAAFLAASAWHFGTEDARGRGWAVPFKGGLPIALPVLLHPAATAGVFAALSGLAFEAPPAWLTAAAIVWLVPAAMAVSRRSCGMSLPAALCVAFAVLPPLTAFALYFVAVHAPAHTDALIRHPARAPRVRDRASAWRLAMPATILTVAIGAALWPVYAGPAPERLLRVTLRLLSALTLPHMVLDAWLERRDKAGRLPPERGGKSLHTGYLAGHPVAMPTIR